MKTLILTACVLLGVAGASNSVYVSPSGKKYHTHKECQYIKNSDVKTISVKDAQGKGLTICSRCKAKDNKAKEAKK